MFAGMFSMRLYIHDLNAVPDFDHTSIRAWQLPTEDDDMELKKFTCRVAIYQCESLPPADKEGSSDPYIEVVSYPEEKKGTELDAAVNAAANLFNSTDVRVKTELCMDTNNPIYYELKEFDMYFREADLKSK